MHAAHVPSYNWRLAPAPTQRPHVHINTHINHQPRQIPNIYVCIPLCLISPVLRTLSPAAGDGRSCLQSLRTEGARERLAPPHLVYSHLTEMFTWWAKGRFISDYGLSSGTLLACPDLRMLLAPLFTPHWDFEVWLDSGGSWKNCHGLAWLVQMRLPPERIGRVGSAAFRLISTVRRVG